MTTAAPCFFVQNNFVEPLTAPVTSFANTVGYPLIERTLSEDFDAAHCGVDWSQFSPVLPYGSVQLLRKLREVPALQQFLLYDEVRFSASEWERRLGPAMLNHGGGQVTVDGVADLLTTGRFHVRPDSEMKAFNAGIFDRASWAHERTSSALRSDTLCWASPVQDIKREWRCWIVGGIVIEYSQFREGGEPYLTRQAPGGLFNFASRIASTWMPASCAVLDVAETADGYKVVGFEPIHCADWHGADVNEVLAVWMGWARWFYSERAQMVAKLIGG